MGMRRAAIEYHSIPDACNQRTSDYHNLSSVFGRHHRLQKSRRQRIPGMGRAFPTGNSRWIPVGKPGMVYFAAVSSRSNWSMRVMQLRINVPDAADSLTPLATVSAAPAV